MHYVRVNSKARACPFSYQLMNPLAYPACYEASVIRKSDLGLLRLSVTSPNDRGGCVLQYWSTGKPGDSALFASQVALCRQNVTGSKLNILAGPAD